MQTWDRKAIDQRRREKTVVGWCIADAVLRLMQHLQRLCNSAHKTMCVIWAVPPRRRTIGLMRLSSRFESTVAYP
eukprot:141669-Pyramimonas_sp.AAC.1